MNTLAKRISDAYTGVTTTSIPELASQYLAYSRAKRTKATYSTRTTHIGQFVEFCERHELTDVTRLNAPIIDLYLEEYATTHQPGTTHSARQIVRSFMNWVDQYKEISTRVRVDAIAPIKLPKSLPKYIDDKIIDSVLKSHLASPQDRLMIRLMARAGLRISEMVSVRPRDIDGDMMHIVGKGSIERVVYLPDELVRMISAYIDLYLISPTGYLIQGKNGGKMPVNTAWRRIKAAFALVGQEMNPHQLRHSYAIQLLTNGCDIVSIQKALGHTDLKTTQVYLNISDDIMRSQIRNVLG